MRTGDGHSREWLAVVLWAVGVGVFLQAPYLLREADARGGWQFTGILSTYFEDPAGHLSWVRQARDGFVLFEPKFVGADTGGRRVVNLLFLVMGWTARLTGLSVMAVFHLERFLSAVFFLVVAYWFAAQFFERRRMRWVCLVLVTVSAGFQWWPDFCAGSLGSPEVDLVQTSTLLMLREDVMAGPAAGLLLLALGLAGRAVTKGSGFGVQGSGKRRHPETVICGPRSLPPDTRHLTPDTWAAPGRQWALGAALVTLALAAVHPHDVPTVYGVVGALVVVEAVAAGPGRRGAVLGRGMVLLGVIVACSMPLLAYHASVLFGSAAFGTFAALENPFLTDTWWWHYGVVLVLAVVGAGAVVRRRERGRALLVVWPALAALLLATVYPRVQKLQLYNGLQIALCALATRGLSAGKRCQVLFLKKVPDTFFLAVFVAVASLTNVLQMRGVLGPQAPAPPRFLRADEVKALDYLDATAAREEVIACLMPSGTIIPLRTGSRVFAGEPHITPNPEECQRLMERLMGRDGPLTAESVAVILRSARADYVFIDPAARQMGAGDLERTLLESGLAERVCANGHAAVYRVRRNETADGRR